MKIIGNNNIKNEIYLNNQNSQEKNKNNNLIDAIKERIDKKEYEHIGKGGFGNIYKIEYNGKTYAIKQVNLSEHEIKECKNEVNILSSLDNEYIVKYSGSYEDKNIFNIIMEYAGDSNLEKFIGKHKLNPKSIEKDEINDIIKQICKGLKYIHENNIIHRDLKPANIFINGKEIKIGDFGISKISQYAYTCKGSFKYMATEMRAGQKYNNKVDMYALGCIIYELLTKRNYSDDKDLEEVKKISSVYDSKWQKLIDSLLDIKPEKRKNVDGVFEFLD